MRKQVWKATRVITPNWHVMDNETSAKLKKAIGENDCMLKLMTSEIHRRNIAVKETQTVKTHFILVLAGFLMNSLFTNGMS
jgi:hypothetical protein